MIEYTKGDLLRGDAEALVNTVNCVGIMGRGIGAAVSSDVSGQFPKPTNPPDKRDEVQPGRCSCMKTGWMTNPKYIYSIFRRSASWRGKSESRISILD